MSRVSALGYPVGWGLLALPGYLIGILMAPLGALSPAWVSAEASLPLGWEISGLWRFDGLWNALGEGLDDYVSVSGGNAEQALQPAGRIGCGSGEDRRPAKYTGERS